MAQHLMFVSEQSAWANFPQMYQVLIHLSIQTEIEALHFDPRLDAARALLSEVGPQKGSLKTRSAMRSLLDLFRRGEVSG